MSVLEQSPISKQMLKHYSHIRMEAKRQAVGALLLKKPVARKQNTAIANGRC